MLNYEKLAQLGFVVKRFCGVPVERTDDGLIACSNEAVGTFTAVIDDQEIEVPVCQMHVDIIQAEYEVDSDGTFLVD